MLTKTAKYGIGQVVQHRLYTFRGVIYDIDPEFSNSDEWYESIPVEIRPDKNQPFYHLFAESDAENDVNHYVAYVSEQNLQIDETGSPVEHPQVKMIFGEFNPKSNAYAINKLKN